MTRQRLECVRFIAAFSRLTQTQTATRPDLRILSQSGDKSTALQTLRGSLGVAQFDGCWSGLGNVSVLLV